MLCRAHSRSVQVSAVVSSILAVVSFDHGQMSETLLSHARVNQTLIICNAYAGAAPMEVIERNTGMNITKQTPLQYKACIATGVFLENGDQLDFLRNGNSVGTFFATGLPKEQTTLVIIPYRLSGANLVAKFKSHAFSSSVKAQAAIIDASANGGHGGYVQVLDKSLAEEKHQQNNQRDSETDVDYNEIIAVGPGKYEFGMVGNAVRTGDTFSESSVPLEVSGGEQVVVLRVGGLDSVTGQLAYPQEILVYSHESGAVVARFAGLCSMLATVTAVLGMLLEV